MPFSVKGPQGHPITHSISAARLLKQLPALVRKYKSVTVAAAEKAPKQPTKQPPVKANPGHETAAKTRAAIVAFCKWAITHEKQIHYAQERPMERLHQPAELKVLPRSADCSEFATDAYAFAGAPDPNGQGFSGTGYTGTMLEHCRHIGKHEAQPGDLAVFGIAPGHHVVVLLEDGTSHAGNPLVCSHGQERGPIAIRLNAEAAAQPVPVTFLRCID